MNRSPAVRSLPVSQSIPLPRPLSDRRMQGVIRMTPGLTSARRDGPMARVALIEGAKAPLLLHLLTWAGRRKR